MGPATRDKLLNLLGDYCSGIITEEGLERLDELVQQDAEARRCYSDYLFLHAELHCQFAGGEVREPAACRSTSSRSTSSHSTSSRSAWPTWAALAAALLGVALVSSWATQKWVETDRLAGNGQGFEQSMPVARITATRNCRWAGSSRGLDFGSLLRAGQQVRLVAGLAEITFDDGATVLLEGPATLDVQATGGARLRSGRLAAAVPERARGFAVATTNVSVVDLGTEFGMLADASGSTEVHVFTGLVKAEVLDTAGRKVRSFELNSSEAAQVEAAATTFVKMVAQDDQFIRSISPASGPQNGLYAYEAFNYPDGPLAWQNGGFGWAGAWETIDEAGAEVGSTNRVAPGNLVYEGLAPFGNHAIQTAQHNRIRRTLSTSVGGVFDAAGLVEDQDGLRLVGRDGETVYVSFLQRASHVDDVFYGVELHRGDGNPNRVLCVGNGAEGCGYGVTSNYNAYGLRNFPALGEENTEINLIVVRIQFGAGNHDLVTVIRNPESLFDEADCRADAVLRGNFAFDRVSLGNYDGRQKVHEVDELRIGTTFLAVTGRQAHEGGRLLPRVAWGRAGIGLFAEKL